MTALQVYTITLYCHERNTKHQCRFDIGVEPPSFTTIYLQCAGTVQRTNKRRDVFVVDLLYPQSTCPAFNARERLLLRNEVRKALEEQLEMPVRIRLDVIDLSVKESK